jgi:hypothetical protein
MGGQATTQYVSQWWSGLQYGATFAPVALLLIKTPSRIISMTEDRGDTSTSIGGEKPSYKTIDPPTFFGAGC